jgi:hypothetical protein
MALRHYDAAALYQLLPAIYRQRDAEHGYALRDLCAVLAEPLAAVARDVAQLADDAFVETCAPWAIPYHADLLGIRDLSGASRAQVANTLGYRRRKGTAGMLEQLARDVTGWPTRVVELFEHLAWTQHMNHRRPGRGGTLNLRSAAALELLGGPYEQAAHLVDVRRIEPRRGRYNLPNLAFYSCRLGAFPRERTMPGIVDAAQGHFTFEPLGVDTQLFQLPLADAGIDRPASIDELPLPLGKRRLKALLADRDGAAGPVARHVRFEVLDTSQPGVGVWQPLKAKLVAADLGVWTRALPTDPGPGDFPAGIVAVDPVRGRFRFADPTKKPAGLACSWHLGFNGPLGGGAYDRVTPDEAAELDRIPLVDRAYVGNIRDPRVAAEVARLGLDPNQVLATVQLAIDFLNRAWPEGGVRRLDILDSRTYAETLTLPALPAKARLVVRAADRQFPTIVLGAPWLLAGGADSRLELDGLRIAGAPLQVVADGGDALATLSLRHCTLIPGWRRRADGTPQKPGAVSLSIATASTETTIALSILGALELATDAQCSLDDCIVDVDDAESLAIGGVAGAGPGGVLTLRRCTVIGRCRAQTLELAESCLLLGTVTVQRRQQGCVRFCWLPRASRTPRRYRCQPGDAQPTPHPIFTSLRFGHPGYCQVHWRTPDAIRAGADGGGEMGAWSFLQQGLREADLRRRLVEYLPTGLEAGILYLT